MAVPILFANQTGPIPLQYLDQDFASFAGSGGSGQVGLDATANYALGTLGAWANERVDVSMFPYLASTTSSDNTLAINNACAFVSGRGGGVVTLPAGTFKQSTLIKVPAGVVLEGQGDSTIFQCTQVIPTDPSIPGSAHQGQSIALTGAGTGARGFKIDGQNFSTGGIVASGISKFFVQQITTINGGSSGGCQSFQFYNSSNFIAWGCDVTQNLHGFQIWNCSSGRVFANKTNMTSSGLYTAACTSVLVYGNQFQNCDDLCLDFEGGLDCHAFGNYVTGGNNAELGFFQDGTGGGIGNVNCTMRNNIVRRTATFINRSGVVQAVNTTADAGAMWVSSLSAGTRDCGFFDNDITVEAGAGFAWYISAGYGTGPQDFHIQDNDIRFEGTGAMWVVTGSANGLKHNDNTYDISQSIGATSTVKNVKGGQFSNNRFNCIAAPSVALVQMYSDIAAQQTCIVSRNEFYGTGDNAMFVDQNASGYETYTLIDNKFTTTQTAHGGLTVNVANEVPRYISQSLLIAESNTANGTITVDIGAIQAINSTTAALRPIANISYVNQVGGVTRNLYQLMFMTGKVASLNSTGSGSGVGASTSDFVSGVSGSVVSITKTVASPNNSMFKVTMDSFSA